MRDVVIYVGAWLIGFGTAWTWKSGRRRVGRDQCVAVCGHTKEAPVHRGRLPDGDGAHIWGATHPFQGEEQS